MIATDGKKETGMLFKGPLVLALLDGSKTQTRRVVKGLNHAPHAGAVTRKTDGSSLGGVCWDFGGPPIYCPYGQVGDRIWVRETWRHTAADLDEARRITGDIMSGSAVDYRATYIDKCKVELGFSQEDAEMADSFEQWRPSIHMPRWACRILLEITSVRVERLQDIGAGDAYDEGTQEWAASVVRDGNKFSSILSAFRSLWESTGGVWDANPWVWVVGFKRVTP